MATPASFVEDPPVPQSTASVPPSFQEDPPIPTPSPSSPAQGNGPLGQRLATGAYHLLNEFFGPKSALADVSRGMLGTLGLPETLDDVPGWMKKLATDPQTGQVPTDPRGKIGMAVMNLIGGPLRAQVSTFQKPGWQEKVAGSVPLFGPIGSKGAEEVRAGKGFQALGTAFTPELGALGSSPGRASMSEALSPLSDLKAGVSGKAALVKGAHASLEKSADAAKTDLVVAKANVANRVGELVDSISNADLAESSAKGSVGSVKLAKVNDALTEAIDKYGATFGKNPQVASVSDLLSSAPPRMQWEMAKDLRTEIGQQMYRAAEGTKQRAVIGSAYKTLTDLLAERANKLGKDEEFSAYNKLHSIMMDYLHDGILGKVMNTDSGLKFFDEIRKPSNGPQLTALNKDLGQFGLADNFFEDLKDSHKATYRLAKSSESSTAGFRGKFAALGAHPIAAGSAFAATAMIPGALPAKFIMSLFAASKAADVADRVQAHAEMTGLGGVPEVSGKFGEAAKVKP